MTIPASLDLKKMAFFAFHSGNSSHIHVIFVRDCRHLRRRANFSAKYGRNASLAKRKRFYPHVLLIQIVYDSISAYNSMPFYVILKKTVYDAYFAVVIVCAYLMSMYDANLSRFISQLWLKYKIVKNPSFN